MDDGGFPIDRAPSDATLIQALRDAAGRDVAQRADLAEAQSQAEAARAGLAQEARRRAEAEAWLAAMRASLSWRLTAPLRAASYRFPVIARPAAHLARVLMRALGHAVRPAGLRPTPQETVWLAAPGDPGPPETVAPPAPARAAPVGVADIRLGPPADPPTVSVIVPSYAQAGYTRRCLAALARSDLRGLGGAGLEVIVSDDASDDPEVAALGAVPNLRLLLQPQNLGFVRNCNAAAAAATGRYLLFLNNDTEVAPGAVAAMVRTAEADPGCGIVGAKLVYPDGTLQEAGGIIWRDGSAWNYGRGGDAAAPQFSYRRTVDYVSGAALLIRRDLFAAMGGFDEAFAPAYCEDSDLAFRVRARGLTVVYDPEAVVIHHEGVSNGTDVTTGLKAYQTRNTAVLRDRWQDVLRREHFDYGAHVLRARDRAGRRRIVLVVDHYVPQPDRDAGSCTMMAFMGAMQSAGWTVKFRPDNGLYDPRYAPALERRGIEVLHGPSVPSLSAWLQTHGLDIDAVLLSRPQEAAASLPGVRALTRAPILFYGHDIHAARLRAQGARGDAHAAAAAIWTEALEREVWRAVDVVLYPSEAEAAEVRRLEPAATARAIVPYAFDAFPLRDRAAPGAGLLFVAGFAHPPNLDAATWLVRDILPRVLARCPQAHLVLAGSNPTAAVKALARPGVTVTGSVSDDRLAALYRDARVAIVPLRVGAGVKMKVVEAMQQGVPVVTTTVGAQGLADLPKTARVTDDAEAMAAHIVALLEDDAAWLHQSGRQTAYAAARFGQAALQAALTAVFDDADAACRPR